MKTLGTDSHESQSIARNNISAVVIQPPMNTTQNCPVGGISVLDRWQKGLAGFGAAVQTVPSDDISRELANHDDTIILAMGDWVIETLGHEAIAEAGANCRSDEIITFSSPGLETAPSICLGPTACQTLSQNNSWQTTSDWNSLLKTAQNHGIQVTNHHLEKSFWQKVDGPDSAKRASWGLLKRLQWRPGGLIAQYINRPVSIRLSRLLVNTPVTPNQITMLAFLIGLAGIGLLFLPGYEYLVLGALLLQINSILDGIDGELARMRLVTSEFGANFDSVCDEILNTLLFVALGYRLAEFGGWFNGVPYLELGIFAGATAFIYSLVHWHCKWKHGLGFYWWFEAYKPRKQLQRSNSPFALFKKLFWKESYLFLFLVFSVIGIHESLLWIALPAGVMVWILFFIHMVIKRARW